MFPVYKVTEYYEWGGFNCSFLNNESVNQNLTKMSSTVSFLGSYTLK